MKPIKIDNEDIKEAIQSGYSYIQAGSRKFLLLEVEEVHDHKYYEVTDPLEEEQLLNALNEENPLLTEEEINKMLGRQP